MGRRGRRKRKPLTDEQVKKIKKEHRNYMSRKRYRLNNMEKFFVEYIEICRKYNCYIDSLSGEFIEHQKRGEKIYTIKSHLGSLEHSLEKEYE